MKHLLSPYKQNWAAQRSSSNSWRSFAAGILFLITTVLAFESCKPANQSSIDERPAARTDSVLTDTKQTALSFDPLGAQGDAQIVPEALRDSVVLRFEPASANGLALEPDDSFSPEQAADTLIIDTAVYDTYRIQLYNSRVYSESALERSVAIEIFDYNVTLDYEVPYFKVRLGDFPQAKLAEKYLKDYVKPAGYPDSWVARVRVTPQKSAEAQALLTAYFDSLRTAILFEGLNLEALDSLGVLDSLTGDTLVDSNSVDEFEGDDEDDNQGGNQ